MELPPFLLDHWLASYEFASPPIAYNLASSTGPRWTVDELLAIDGGRHDIGKVTISYAPAEGSHELREGVAAFHGVDPEWVVVTTGASEALSILFCLAARPGANIVLPSPAFPAFEAMAKAWGLGVRLYELPRDDGYRQSAGAVLSAVDTDTVLVLVSTPHNPTGSVMSGAETERLAGELSSRGIPLIADEVYHPLYFEAPAPSAAALPGALVVSDMSKALSLPGLRIGWIVVADPDHRKRIIDARSYFTISGSPVIESIAAHALRCRAAILKRLSGVATDNLAVLEEFMDDVGDVLAWSKPAGGTVSFPWFRDGRDSRPFCQALAAQGVMVAPGDCFGKPQHMRLGFGQQADGFGQALTIATRVLREG
jgi:aspartate/methionine/tyrosine aminotransferase